VLQPNTGGAFWDTPSADCYAGIAARWYVDVWGDHNRETSMVRYLAGADFGTQTMVVRPAFPKLLSTFGVSHLLSPYPESGAALALVGQDSHAYVYRIDGATRARVVRAARRVSTDREAAARLLDAGFDPNREVLLHDAPESVRPRLADVADASSNIVAGRAVVTHEDSRRLVIQTDAVEDGFLMLADTFYPGWSAQVDRTPTPIYRANLYVRAVQLPKGHHEVQFVYDAPGFARGLQITLVALSMLLLSAGAAASVLWLNKPGS
jgi:hypothetical protein